LPNVELSGTPMSMEQPASATVLARATAVMAAMRAFLLAKPVCVNFVRENIVYPLCEIKKY
jgi:hypothetical protein